MSEVQLERGARVASGAARLARRLKVAALASGAAVAGVADLTAMLADPPPRPLHALAFGIRYPDAAIDRLPVEDELDRALDDIGRVAQRIYATIEGLIHEADAGARCCHHDALGDTFGALQSVPSQKAVAALAGLGWIGKSSLLVTPAHGPRLRLGTLHTDAGLLPDAPFPTNRCGDCHVCKGACPSGAVTEETVSFHRLLGYRIDASTCRAHLTCDGHASGGRAFCGLCMKVCPFGRGTRPT